MKNTSNIITFRVTPRTLIASFTWWWVSVCLSSSHTHSPRLQIATHLKHGQNTLSHSNHSQGKTDQHGCNHASHLKRIKIKCQKLALPGSFTCLIACSLQKNVYKVVLQTESMKKTVNTFGSWMSLIEGSRFSFVVMVLVMPRWCW